MSRPEATEILTKSQGTTGVSFSPRAGELIVSLAQGFPHYTHLLGLHSVRLAADQGSWTVEEGHVRGALEKAIISSQQSLQRAYHSATTSPRKDNLFAEVLLACAVAGTDELGYFAASDLREPPD